MADAADTLAGPGTITVRRRAPHGPFGAARWRLPVGPVRFAIANISGTACTIERCAVDPVRDAASGLATAGQLAIAGEAAAIAPGEAATFTLSGDIAARPGSYASTARIAAAAGTTLACPVAIEIEAHPAWGILAMLLGLLLVGALNLLSGAGDIEEKRRAAAADRQAIAEMLDRTPPPASLDADAATMDDDFARAIAILSHGRAASLLDHRAADAQPLLADADRIAARLRAAIADRGPGETAIEDLEAEWHTLLPVIGQMQAPLPQGSASDDFAGRLNAYLVAERDRLVRAPAGAVAAEMATELTRMKLEAATGNGQAARDLALNTRLWLQRSAASLERGATLQREGVGRAVAMLERDRTLRAHLASDDIPPGTRAGLLAALDAAEARLSANATIEDERAANLAIEQATTARLQAVLAVLHAAHAQALAAASAATSIDDINALIEKLQAAPLPHTTAMKTAGMREIVALWRVHVARLPDPDARAALDRVLDATAALIDQGRLMDAASQLQADYAALPGELRKLIEAADDRIDHGNCVDLAADIEHQEEAIDWELRAQASDARTASWDVRADALHAALQRAGPDAVAIGHDCTTPLLAIDRDVMALANDILAATLADTTLRTATKSRLLAEIPAIGTSGITAASIAGPRRLAIVSPAPDAALVAGRRVLLRVEGADPGWGVSTVMRIAYGDGTTEATDAERLGRAGGFAHVYAAETRARVELRATQGSDIVGAGERRLDVLPSPVSRARRISDEFLSLRFALALAIAAIAYFWRFHARRDVVFGARSYDYVEAFALGFAVYAAVSDLPKAIAGLLA